MSKYNLVYYSFVNNNGQGLGSCYFKTDTYLDLQKVTEYLESKNRFNVAILVITRLSKEEYESISTPLTSNQ